MTPKERFEAVIYGKPYDRIPCSLNVGPWAANLLGMSFREFGSSAEHQTRGAIAAYRMLGSELAGPFADVLGPLGLEYEFPEDSTPYVRKPKISDRMSLDRIEIPDYRSRADSAVLWETLERMLEAIGDEIPITIGIGGPFTAAAQMRGTETFLRELLSDSDFAHAILDLVTEAGRSMVREVGKYGVRFCIYDPIASGSMISPQLYKAFAKPYETRLIAAMKEASDDKPTLHICGNTSRIWKDMAATGAGILSLDNIVDLEDARREVGGEVALMGNVNPTDTMLSGTPIDVEAAVVDCVRKAAGNPGGYILALGCGLPFKTPIGNILALIEAAREHGRLPIEACSTASSP
jgi:uroporphyrinogen decarboxylase